MDKNDEFMHPPGEEKAWSESYYFNFRKNLDQIEKNQVVRQAPGQSNNLAIIGSGLDLLSDYSR